MDRCNIDFLNADQPQFNMPVMCFHFEFTDDFENVVINEVGSAAIDCEYTVRPHFIQYFFQLLLIQEGHIGIQPDQFRFNPLVMGADDFILGFKIIPDDEENGKQEPDTNTDQQISGQDDSDRQEKRQELFGSELPHVADEFGSGEIVPGEQENGCQ